MEQHCEWMVHGTVGSRGKGYTHSDTRAPAQTRTHWHARTPARTHAHTCTHMHAHARAHTHTLVSARAYPHAHIWVCMLQASAYVRRILAECGSHCECQNRHIHCSAHVFTECDRSGHTAAFQTEAGGVSSKPADTGAMPVMSPPSASSQTPSLARLLGE
jgi:hypothetical protein